MEISQRDVKVAVGLVAAGASRYYFAKRQLWPWRISTLIAWPALGLGIMDTVIGWQAPKDAVRDKVDSASSEEAQQHRLARDALAKHFHDIAERTRAEQAAGSGSSSSGK